MIATPHTKINVARGRDRRLETPTVVPPVARFGSTRRPDATPYS
jgi:hypothetical protein